MFGRQLNASRQPQRRSMNALRLRQLQTFCRSLGGDLVHINKIEFERMFADDESFEPAPFTQMNEDIGFNWHAKTIFIVQAYSSSLIHEMGHVFGALFDPSAPEAQDPSDYEVDFFGWEYLVAAKHGVLDQWFIGNLHYCCGGDDGYFGELSRCRQMEFICEAIERGLRSNLISAALEPLSVR